MCLLPLLVALPTPAIVIDPAVSQGKWEGWGTSLCWMGKVFGDRDDVADLLFTTKRVTIGGEELPGLGMNIARYNAGACSWNEVDGRQMVVSKTILPYRQMEGFWLDGKSENPDSNSWEWSLDSNQRAMLLGAKKRGANRFELFSNSPMWWMCANDNPSGDAKGTADNLRSDAYHDFAVYMAAVARRAKQRWGIAFTTIDPFNEPASSWWNEDGKQEGCHFSASSQEKFLPLLRRELDRFNLGKLPIAASDETYVTHALQTWNQFGKSTRELVGQINVHGYEGEKSPRGDLRAAIGDRPLWVSEHGENDGSGLSMARAINLDFHLLMPLAWCYWQPLDGGGWGLVQADLLRAKILRSNPKYFVMAQFTRHIRPEMTILKTDDPDLVAAYDPKGHRLVMVASNFGESEVGRSFDLSRFKRIGHVADHWLTEPKGAARYQKGLPLPLKGKLFEFRIPARSVETFEISRTES